MNILIAYSSLTGNTETIARAIAEAFGDDAVIAPIEKAPDHHAFDYVLVGFWADKGTCDAKAERYLKTLEGANVGLFATLGAYPYSLHAHQILVRAAENLPQDARVFATFICQGKVNPALLERFKSMPKDNPHYPTPKTMRRHEVASTHPDERDCREAAELFAAAVRDDALL